MQEGSIIKKKGLLIFTLLAVGLMVVLIVTYAGKVSVLYLKAEQVFARLDQSAKTAHKGKEALVGKIFRIHGHLKPKTTKRTTGRIDYEFQIMDKKTRRSLTVQYHGILPDTFRDNAELVLEGKLLKPNLYKAYSVFAKCPTKYKEDKNYGKKKKTSPAI